MFGRANRKLQHRLTEATDRIPVAEGELSAAMAELILSDRADKEIVGDRLRSALAELVAARLGLAALVGSPA